MVSHISTLPSGSATYLRFFCGTVLCKTNRGWGKKKFTNVFCHTTKMIEPRVKSLARGQNNGPRALKWGIVHLCSLLTLRDRTSFIEVWVFWISRFCKKCRNYYAKL